MYQGALSAANSKAPYYLRLPPMKLHEIIALVEKIAPPQFAASWDNCGVQVASHTADISHLALCLDPTPQSVSAAIAQGAQCIISHHPLLMQGRLPSKLDNYHETLRLLLQNDVTLYAAHTSLDVNGDGPAGWLARALSLQKLKVLESVCITDDELCQPHEFGYGLVGTLPKALSYNELLDVLGQYISLEGALLCARKPTSIARVAYCTGSGSSFMHKAHKLGADIFITGDVKYHSALESPLCTLDVGHHSLEEVMMQEFTTLLTKILPTVQVEFVPSVSPLRPA